MQQVAIPVAVEPREVQRKTSLGGALELCAELAGLEPKQVQSDLKLDKAQWSRWVSGQEGVVWSKFAAVMDHCGNDAPVMWMAHARGFDIARMARYETAIERENRMLREENAALKRVIVGAGA
jgi:hypothetical protein